MKRNIFNVVYKTFHHNIYSRSADAYTECYKNVELWNFIVHSKYNIIFIEIV